MLNVNKHVCLTRRRNSALEGLTGPHVFDPCAWPELPCISPFELPLELVKLATCPTPNGIHRKPLQLHMKKLEVLLAGSYSVITYTGNEMNLMMNWRVFWIVSETAAGPNNNLNSSKSQTQTTRNLWRWRRRWRQRRIRWIPYKLFHTHPCSLFCLTLKKPSLYHNTRLTSTAKHKRQHRHAKTTRTSKSALRRTFCWRGEQSVMLVFIFITVIITQKL
jgi:hypothetical protein